MDPSTSPRCSPPSRRPRGRSRASCARGTGCAARRATPSRRGSTRSRGASLAQGVAGGRARRSARGVGGRRPVPDPPQDGVWRDRRHLRGGAHLGRDARRDQAAAGRRCARSGGERPATRREAEALGLSWHPNVVEVIDHGYLPDGTAYLVMELLPGESLAGRLQSKGRLSPRELLPIAMQLCDALAAVHAAGVVHRDVKPSNIYLAVDRGRPRRSRARQTPRLRHRPRRVGRRLASRTPAARWGRRGSNT